jgi:excisionase family DNA binding protein
MSVKARAAVLLSDEVLDAVAERVLERLPVESAAWLGAKDAAAHLGCSVHRVYRLTSERRIPHEHEGGRLVFNRNDLDAWVRAGGAK